MPITVKQLLGSAAESRCTVSCVPYEMPEEIFGWSETRNVIRLLSTYGKNTSRMKRMISSHLPGVEGTHAVQTVISPEIPQKGT